LQPTQNNLPREPLSRLRLSAESSGGRKYPEFPHPYRNNYQRDRDRVIHARGFRRLEGKTQVFAPSLSDHFRNRLTHTLEVSQIARTVAAVLGLNDEFTETLALAHDIGHPPFAHAGEKELDRQMQRFGSGFEHNLHSLRIVDHLERRYALFDGLNLTFEVREGIVKHSREVQPGERDDLEEFLPGLKPPLESQLIDLADEIAYNAADLDDGFSAGLIDLEEVRAAIPFLAARLEETEGMFPGAAEQVKFNEVLRSLINYLVGGLIEGTHQRAMESRVANVADVRKAPSRIAAMTEETAALNRQLKAFLAGHVYESADLIEHRARAVEKIAWLFQFLAAHPDQISAGFRENLETEPVERVVCDYIAGMTDGYFVKTYEALRGELLSGICK
jgi:dGTPase